MVRPHRLSVAAFTAVFLLGALSAIPAAANSTAQPLPFTQNWSNIQLIQTANVWTSVPGVIGYRGQDLTSTPGVDPQTVLGVSTVANDVHVLPNLTNTSITNGGVGEFHLADPVVAIQGSDTSEAPYLLFHVDTAGFANVSVSYDLRDIDPTGDDAVQQVALQYRVGSGNFTNVPAGFVADATTGGAATLVTPVHAKLPAAAAGQPLVQVRVITTNAAGNDEWVGIDNIVVTDAAPSITAVDPADTELDVAMASSIDVTFDEPVGLAAGAIDVECDGTPVTGTTTGGPTTWTFDPAADLPLDATCTIDLAAGDVTDADVIDPPDAMSADFQSWFTTVAPTPTPTPTPDPTPTPTPDPTPTPTPESTPTPTPEPTPTPTPEPTPTPTPEPTPTPTPEPTPTPTPDPTPTPTPEPTPTPTPDPTPTPTPDPTPTPTPNPTPTPTPTPDPTPTPTPDPTPTPTPAQTPTPTPTPGSPIVDAGGPYAIVEGTTGALVATGAEPHGGALSYAWDLDLNGTFETAGQAVTFSATGLEAPASRTVSVRVTGPTGLMATDTANINVIWQFGGFAGKNEGRPSLTTAKAGANLTLRFSLDGDQGMAVIAAGYPRSGPYTCGGAPLLDATEPVAGDVNFAGSGQYSFAWKTNKAWANTCRTLVLNLADGTYQYVDVFFDK